MASCKRSGAAVSSPGATALGKHEELSTPSHSELEPDAGPEPARCTCGPVHLRLRSEHGELVKPRGKSVNRCDYCAKLAAVENCEMLSLDAMEGDPPTVLLVLGTRTATVDMAAFYRGLEKVRLTLRRRWPAAEYASLVEFTTGYGPRSGGLRRPHWNLAWKGIPADAATLAGEIAFPVWCRHVDAEQHAQHASPIRSGEALAKYLALHFQKESQRPPANFTGQRFNCSRGYFTGATRATARARARESLSLGREVWKQLQRTDEHAPTNAHDVELNAQLAYAVAASTRWVLASETGGRLSDQAIAKRSLTQRLAATQASPGDARPTPAPPPACRTSCTVHPDAPAAKLPPRPACERSERASLTPAPP